MKTADPAALRHAPSNRPTIMGTRHVIAAGHYLAAHAGFEILEAGGNAIDAGVAAGIAVGVLQTDKVNFGGVAPMIIYMAKTRAIHCIDGLGVWPQAIKPDYFQKNHGGKIPPGVLRSVVPAAPDAWITALERFGTMSFADVASAAIRFARHGFPMYPLMSQFITDNQSSYERWPSNKKVFLPKGRPPQPGDLFIQTELAGTLQYLADVEKANKRRGRGPATPLIFAVSIVTATQCRPHHPMAPTTRPSFRVSAFCVRAAARNRGPTRRIRVRWRRANVRA